MNPRRTAARFPATRRAGFSMVELLVALAIIAMLMVSLTAVLDAFLTSYRETETSAVGVQAGRSILARLANDIRTATAVETTGASVTLVPPASRQLTQIAYTYDASTDQLTYQENGTDGNSTLSVLMGTSKPVITGFTVSEVRGKDFQGTDCVKSVTIALTYTVDGNPFAYTISASPRGNQSY